MRPKFLLQTGPLFPSLTTRLLRSHWAAVQSLGKWLEDAGIPGITGVDTRQITKHLRTTGCMLGKVMVGGAEPDSIPWDDINARNIVAQVSIPRPVSFNPSGDLDILVVNLNDPPDLLINKRGNKSGHWLMLRLVGNLEKKTNLEAIGTKILVHSGGMNGGHYYAFIRPLGMEQWYRFDDERVTKVKEKEAVEAQFGGLEHQQNPGHTPQWKYPKISSAYTASRALRA